MRKRLTWTKKADKNPNHPPYSVVEDNKDLSDPYNMNADHENPPVSKYETGTPSTWAEDPDMDQKWKEDKRNEVGIPAADTRYDGQGEKEWGSEYQKKAAIKTAQALQLKALKCVKIASLILPEGTEETWERQGYSLMFLPNQEVDQTLTNLTAGTEAPKPVTAATLLEDVQTIQAKLASTTDETVKVALEKEASELIEQAKSVLAMDEEKAEEKAEEEGCMEEEKEEEKAEEEGCMEEEKEEEKAEEEGCMADEEAVVAKILLAKVNKLIKKASKDGESADVKKQAEKLIKFASVLLAEDEEEKEEEEGCKKADQNDRAMKNWPAGSGKKESADEEEMEEKAEDEGQMEDEKAEEATEEKAEEEGCMEEEKEEEKAEEEGCMEEEEKADKCGECDEDMEEGHKCKEATQVDEIDRMFEASDEGAIVIESDPKIADIDETLLMSQELLNAREAFAQEEVLNTEISTDKKAGVKTLKNVKLKEASKGDEIKSISDLWATDPDVTGAF